MRDPQPGRFAHGAVAALRGLWRALPPGVRARVEGRFFRAVRRATRVTDDGYPLPEDLRPRSGPGR